MPESRKQSFTLQSLAETLELEYSGNAAIGICSVASFPSAGPQDLCFLLSRRYLVQARKSDCAAIIVPLGFGEDLGSKALLYSRNPYLSFVQVMQLLHPQAFELPPAQTHASAVIDESAMIGENVSIGANCVIGADTRIAADCIIGPGCIIESGCSLGKGTRLHAQVTLCHDVSIGKRVILHPGVVIGSDGYGLVKDHERWIKVPHLGTVRIGDDVEIGANTTVDRGALDDTIIENGVKLDNLIQVAHNVIIGENTVIAGCAGIAGSAVIGRNCQISGGAVVLGHLSVADNTTITARSLVTKSIQQSGTYSSGTPLLENRLWHRNNARYKMLDEMAKEVARLGKNKQDKS